jgi:tRNA-dihydrouridine synthase
LIILLPVNNNPLIYLAPLQGITTYIYRKLFSKYFGSIDKYFAPFITAKEDSFFRVSKLKDLLPENNRGIMLVPQLMGNEAGSFAAAAELLHDCGYNEINWNLGCPFPMVTRKLRGSGLLPEYDKIKALLDALMPKLKTRLSIKMRLGLSSSTDILKLLPLFNDYPLSEVIIHPRIGKQMYEGRVDLDAFEAALNLAALPVVYNGDINTAEDFIRLKKRFPALKTIMLGRGALQNPFLPESLKCGKEVKPDFIKLKAFHDELLSEYQKMLSGDKHLVDRMKEFWFYFSQSFSEREKIFGRIKKVKSWSDYLKAVDEAFR